MKIALYSREQSANEQNFLCHTIRFMTKKGHEVFHSFRSHNELKALQPIDFLFSFGGDGTFLEAASLVADLNIPIMGINTGRIGFLTDIAKQEFEQAFTALETGKFILEIRSLLHVYTPNVAILPANFALNDITLHSAEAGCLCSMKVELNNQNVNTYWADGLIIATPSGSTAYSMSCGGPIIAPQTNVNVITPIASHSLSVRPIVVSNEQEIKIRISGRSKNYTLGIDFHRITIPDSAIIIISKENFQIHTVRITAKDFFAVIREKLMWGIDKRNKN